MPKPDILFAQFGDSRTNMAMFHSLLSGKPFAFKLHVADVFTPVFHGVDANGAVRMAQESYAEGKRRTSQCLSYGTDTGMELLLC